jgi:hypothetical protein
MLHFKLGPVRVADPADGMDRDLVGYDPSASAEENFDRNRGVWLLGPRAERETHALFSSIVDGTVKFVVAIDNLEPVLHKKALVGRVLPATDPLHQGWVGGKAPDSYRNPVTYVTDDNRPAATCACICGESVSGGRTFLPGHDQRAIHARIVRQWGNTVGFLDWFDATYPPPPAAGAGRP